MRIILSVRWFTFRYGEGFLNCIVGWTAVLFFSDTLSEPILRTGTESKCHRVAENLFLPNGAATLNHNWNGKFIASRDGKFFVNFSQPQREEMMFQFSRLPNDKRPSWWSFLVKKWISRGPKKTSRKITIFFRNHEKHTPMFTNRPKRGLRQRLS